MILRIPYCLLLSLGLFLLGCGEQPTVTDQNQTKDTISSATKNPITTASESDNDKARIVFFGNSLTAGYGLDEQYAFTAHIQKKIDSVGLNYEVVNAGLSGETTAGGLNRIGWVMEQPIDVFVLELGGNDALRGFELSNTRDNLGEILAEVKAKYPDVQLVVAGMEAPPNMGPAYTSEFRSIYPEVAQAHDAALIPFLLEDVGGIPELNLPDLVHPNEQGQVIVAENVWRVLGELL